MVKVLFMGAREELPHVVILGGGFGGLAAARVLGSSPVRVTLVDRSNHHLFQPLLYQVATALLPAPDIAAPLRNILSARDNIRVLLAEAQRIDVEQQLVVLDHEEPLRYDYLIVATGLKNHYFGHPEWEQHAPGLKTLYDALEIRNRVLLAFEAAERLDDPKDKRAFLTFVVVGGGATGVELAGQLAEISRNALRKDFTTIDPSSARIILVEGADRIFRDYSPALSECARRDLVSLGVEVRTSTLVTDLDGSGVTLGGNERIDAHTVLWAAGVRASSLTEQLGAELDELGRVKVTPHCTVPGRDEIAVIGDLMSFPRKKDGTPLPAVAQVALQSGKLVASNILRRCRGEPLAPFKYFDKGLMATIGRNRAIVESRGFSLTGMTAWLAWLFIHIAFLVGFRNRISVLSLWIWAYLTNDRASRVVFSNPKEQGPAVLEPRPSRPPSRAEQATAEASIPTAQPKSGWPWSRSDD
jgi:NADH dehydrogenase